MVGTHHVHKTGSFFYVVTTVLNKTTTDLSMENTWRFSSHTLGTSQIINDAFYPSWVVASFVLRDLFLPVSICDWQTNKTDGSGNGVPVSSLWNSPLLPKEFWQITVNLAAPHHVSYPQRNKKILFLPMPSPRIFV